MLLLNHQVSDKALLKLDKIQITNATKHFIVCYHQGVFVTCIYCKEEFS